MWTIGVIALNVLFMNFIIAVISESDVKVLQKATQKSLKLKA